MNAEASVPPENIRVIQTALQIHHVNCGAQAGYKERKEDQPPPLVRHADGSSRSRETTQKTESCSYSSLPQPYEIGDKWRNGHFLNHLTEKKQRPGVGGTALAKYISIGYATRTETRQDTGRGRQGKRNGKRLRTDDRIMASQMTRRCGLALTANRSFSTQS